MQVPNQTLMRSGVTNLSDSKPVAVYTTIDIDATVSPLAIQELSRRMKAAAAAHQDLFDPTFDSRAYIMNIVTPLKYQVSSVTTTHCDAVECCSRSMRVHVCL